MIVHKENFFGEKIHTKNITIRFFFDQTKKTIDIKAEKIVGNFFSVIFFYIFNFKNKHTKVPKMRIK